MTKSVDDPTPNVGDTVTYIVTISNGGPNTATSVQVSDELPSGISFVSAMPSQGTYDLGTGIWSVGTVTTSAPETLVIRGIVNSPDPQANTTRITHSDQYNPNEAGSVATVTVTPQQAELALSKTVSDPTPVVGETITYTILLSNSGPDAATSVQVTEHLPSGLSFVSAAPSQGTYDPGAGLWSVGTVAVGSPAMLLIRATVTSPDPQTNAATITHADQYDPLPTSNTDGLVVLATPAAPATPSPTVTALQRFGFHEQPTILVLTFSEPLDPARAQDVGNYHLTLIAHAGRLHLPVRLTRAVYNAAADTVTLHPARLLPLRFHYKLVVNGSSPTGVSDPSGILLDGAGNGVPGSDYVRVFGRKILAGPNRDSSAKAIHAAQHSRVGGPHSTTRAAGPVPHTPASTGRSERIGAAMAGKTHVRLSVEAVDAVLATRSSAHELSGE